MELFILVWVCQKDDPGQLTHEVLSPPAKVEHFGFGLLPFMLDCMCPYQGQQNYMNNLLLNVDNPQLFAFQQSL